MSNFTGCVSLLQMSLGTVFYQVEVMISGSAFFHVDLSVVKVFEVMLNPHIRD